MKVVIEIEDTAKGIHLSCEFSEPVTDETQSEAVNGAMIMIEALKAALPRDAKTKGSIS